MKPSSRAKIFADFAASHSDGARVAHIYDDGYVLYLAINDTTAKRTLKYLREVFPVVEVARSGDGMFIAVVLPATSACQSETPRAAMGLK